MTLPPFLAVPVAAMCAALAVLAAPMPAAAQSCPPGTKFAAGACVTECPGGYEDRGRVCVFRNQNH